MQIDPFLVLYLPMLLFIGVMSTLEDVRNGKVRNSLILLSLGYSILIFALIASIQNYREAAFGALPHYLLNVLFSFIFGGILWYSKLWSAGDAKLFLAYSSLMPPTILTRESSLFPGFFLLSNIVIPYFMYSAGRIFIKTTWQQKTDAVNQFFKGKRITHSLLFSFALLWIGNHFSKIVGAFAPAFNNFITTMMFVFILVFAIKNVYSLSLTRFSLVVAICALLFDRATIFSLQFAISYVIVIVIAFFLREVLLTLSYSVLSNPLYLENLRPGMLPAENIIHLKEEDSYKKIRLLPTGMMAKVLSDIKGDPLIGRPQDGIEEGEIANIQKLHSEDRILFHTIRIYENIAFSPFLLAGAILTLLLQGSLLAGIFVFFA